MATALGVCGYSCDFVQEPPKSVECPICLLPFRDPFLTDCCGHHFCQTCIAPINNNGKPCPICKETTFSVMIDKSKLREVNQLLVYCANKNEGCDWQGDLGQVEKHQSHDCGYVLTACSLMCGERFQRQCLLEHEIDFCPKRTLEAQVKSLTRRLDAASVEITALQNENRDVKLKNVAHLLTIQTQDQKIAEMSALQKEQKKQISNLKFQLECQSLSRELKPLKAETKAQPAMVRLPHYVPPKEVERQCPICNTKFPIRMKQVDFESHVEGHFRR